jgi:uncharacterized protein YukE
MTVGLTVPGGDPAALRQLAARLRIAAQGSRDLGQNASQLSGAIVSDAQWTGDAADRFSTFTGVMSEGISAAQGPLERIADEVDGYANVLETAQQKAQAATAIAQAAQNDPSGSLIGAAERSGQDALAAIDAVQQAGGQAARQVTTAADDLQIERLFGQQGPVTSWIASQPGLDNGGLWSLGDPVPGETEFIPEAPDLGMGTEIYPIAPDLGSGTETIPIPDDLGLGIETIPVAPGLGTEIETIPQAPRLPLINYDTDLPRLDGSGKVHMPDREDPLPGYVPPDWTREDLEQVEDDLTESIRNRQGEMVRLGENTPSGPAHRARINAEIQLLRQVQKKLGGS